MAVDVEERVQVARADEIVAEVILRDGIDVEPVPWRGAVRGQIAECVAHFVARAVVEESAVRAEIEFAEAAVDDGRASGPMSRAQVLVVHKRVVGCERGVIFGDGKFVEVVRVGRVDCAVVCSQS